LIDFNADWRFARFGPMPDGSRLTEPEGLEKTATDDSSWRELVVPHDWGIEGPFRMEIENRTGKLPWAGIGWYRKTSSRSSWSVPMQSSGGSGRPMDWKSTFLSESRVISHMLSGLSRF